MDSNLSLYNISQNLIELQDKIVNSEGEIDEEKELLLSQLQKILVEKTDEIVDFVEMNENYIEKINARISQLKQMRESVETKLDRFTQYVQGCMGTMGVKKLTGEFSEISLNKNPPSVDKNIDESKLPLDYIHTEQKIISRPDTVKIRKDLVAGLIVSGARLNDPSFNIKFKFANAKLISKKGK